MAREINPQQKMTKVMEAARSLFVEKGYHNVSIPQIVKKSGVSIGAIYHHFGNKEGLAQSVHEQTLQSFQDSFAERISAAENARKKLFAFTTLVFEVAEENPVMMEYMLLMKHDEFLSDVPPICAAEPFQLVQQIIGDSIRGGEIKARDTFLAAVAFTGVITRAVELRLKGVMEISLLDCSEELFNHAWAAIADYSE